MGGYEVDPPGPGVVIAAGEPGEAPGWAGFERAAIGGGTGCGLGLLDQFDVQVGEAVGVGSGGPGGLDTPSPNGASGGTTSGLTAAS
jgi:hypothetical protein